MRESVREPHVPPSLPNTEPGGDEKSHKASPPSPQSQGEAGAYAAEGRRRRGVTPLFQAAAGGNARILGLLVRRSACPERGDERGQTILHVAAQHGRRAAVALLLDYGLPVNAPDRAGNTALHLAVEHGWEEVVELLLDAGADVDGAHYRLPDPTPAAGE